MARTTGSASRTRATRWRSRTCCRRRSLSTYHFQLALAARAFTARHTRTTRGAPAASCALTRSSTPACPRARSKRRRRSSARAKLRSTATRSSRTADELCRASRPSGAAPLRCAERILPAAQAGGPPVATPPARAQRLRIDSGGAAARRPARSARARPRHHRRCSPAPTAGCRRSSRTRRRRGEGTYTARIGGTIASGGLARFGAGLGLEDGVRCAAGVAGGVSAAAKAVRASSCTRASSTR